MPYMGGKSRTEWTTGRPHVTKTKIYYFFDRTIFTSPNICEHRWLLTWNSCSLTWNVQLTVSHIGIQRLVCCGFIPGLYVVILWYHPGISVKSWQLQSTLQIQDLPHTTMMRFDPQKRWALAVKTMIAYSVTTTDLHAWSVNAQTTFSN